MPCYIVRIAPVAANGAARWSQGATIGPVEAASPEDAAAQAVEYRGGDRSKLQATDPQHGIACFLCSGYMLAVERLTP